MTHPLIDLFAMPTLPMAFSSVIRNLPVPFTRKLTKRPKNGCLLANDEFYVVFETYPLAVKQMTQMIGEQQIDPIPVEYLYAASVFYRKSRNPHGPSSRPIYVFCLEYTEFTCDMRSRGLWDTLTGKPKHPAEVFSAVFFADGRTNHGKVPNDFTDASAREYLMLGVCERLGLTRGDFREIGPLSLGADCPEVA
jgi:hypothetical protein